MPRRIVVLFAESDQLVGEWVVHALEAERAPCWTPTRDVEAGVTWRAAIGKAIDTAASVLLLQSRALSGDTLAALAVDLATATGRPVIVARLDRDDPGGQLAGALRRAEVRLVNEVCTDPGWVDAVVRTARGTLADAPEAGAMSPSRRVCRVCGRAAPRGSHCYSCGAPITPNASGRGDESESGRASDARPSLVGAVVDGRYEVLSQLGRGGMLDAYLARHRKTGAQVVLKVLRAEYAANDEMVARVRLEAVNGSRVRDPRVAVVHDIVDLPDGQPCLVVEYAPGESLYALAQREGVLPLGRALDLTRQAASAVGAAHRAGVVHRDVKPGNLIVAAANGRETVRLIDFSISTAIEGPGRDTITRDGFALGVPAYMPPESWRVEPEDARRDVYAIGCLLFELLTGAAPFRGDLMAMKDAHLEAPVPPLPPEVPDEVGAIVRRAMAKQPADRYANGDEMAEALERAIVTLDALPVAERRSARRTFDVFVSYSSADRVAANAVIHALEARLVRCWIAPRDIPAGTDWDEAIMDGIASCRVMVLIHSSRSNASRHVKREVVHAVEHDLTIIPLRIEDVPFSRGLQYHLGTLHWLDAVTPPVEAHLAALVERVAALLR